MYNITLQPDGTLHVTHGAVLLFVVEGETAFLLASAIIARLAGNIPAERRPQPHPAPSIVRN